MRYPVWTGSPGRHPTMARDLVHLMRSLFLPTAGLARQCWAPSVDVYRTRDGWLVKFDLAGVRPEDVALAVEGRCLKLRGSRRDYCLEEGCHQFVMEISYSHFERGVELPEELDRATMTTEFREGM